MGKTQFTSNLSHLFHQLGLINPEDVSPGIGWIDEGADNGEEYGLYP